MNHEEENDSDKRKNIQQEELYDPWFGVPEKWTKQLNEAHELLADNPSTQNQSTVDTLGQDIILFQEGYIAAKALEGQIPPGLDRDWASIPNDVLEKFVQAIEGGERNSIRQK